MGPISECDKVNWSLSQGAGVTVTCLCVSSFQHRVRKPNMFLKFNDIKCVSGMKTFSVCMKTNPCLEASALKMTSRLHFMSLFLGQTGLSVRTAVGLYFPQ